MIETECRLKSQHLTHLADAPDNEKLINSNHFLVPRPYNSLPPEDFSSTRPACFKSWIKVQQLMMHFWRYPIKEYTPFLTKQSIWSEPSDSLKVNDLLWNLKDLTPCGYGLRDKLRKRRLEKNDLYALSRKKHQTVRTSAPLPVSHVFWIISLFWLLFWNRILGNASYPLIYWWDRSPLLWFNLRIPSSKSLLMIHQSKMAEANNTKVETLPAQKVGAWLCPNKRWKTVILR